MSRCFQMQVPKTLKDVPWTWEWGPGVSPYQDSTPGRLQTTLPPLPRGCERPLTSPTSERAQCRQSAVQSSRPFTHLCLAINHTLKYKPIKSPHRPITSKDVRACSLLPPACAQSSIASLVGLQLVLSKVSPPWRLFWVWQNMWHPWTWAWQASLRFIHCNEGTSGRG